MAVVMRTPWSVLIAVLLSPAAGPAFGGIDLVSTTRSVQILPLGADCGFQETTSDAGEFDAAATTTCRDDCDQSVNIVSESSFVANDYVVVEAAASIEGSSCPEAGGAAFQNSALGSGSAEYELGSSRLYSLAGVLTKSAGGGGIAKVFVELRDLSDGLVIELFEVAGRSLPSASCPRATTRSPGAGSQTGRRPRTRRRRSCSDSTSTATARGTATAAAMTASTSWTCWRSWGSST